ncbi:MAG TPA: YifB family Mg chelatase-like AAA ATPase [Candidatus Paceibacterota bacterium]|nr:YifB family Mg chelatase-like AAA ATPase [Candidatus Paceibacterota bacterium]
MKFSRIQCAQVSGLVASGVSVETDVNRGLYLFQIVGLPDKAVEEAKERVLSALRNSLDINVKAENQKVIVSLSPAELKKEGAYFDVAIALGYLTATGVITADLQTKLFVGELALNGEVRPIRGLLSIAAWAKENNIRELFIPLENASEAALVDGISCYLTPTLADLVSHLQGNASLASVPYTPPLAIETKAAVDFGDVRGQLQAKRALTIAAAGGHNIVLYGPPGTGKSMLAKAFHGIVPHLSSDEFLEVATIYSSIGLIEDVLGGSVPLRAPHHSASHVAIIGGGQTLRPGDITLAHRGVLYLDEFPEFDRRVLEALREPMEEGAITVARARGSVRYPAQFILLAAMNPCPCGYRGSGVRHCRCSGAEIARYNKKLSGPIIDRIDLWVPVAHIEYATLHDKAQAQESDRICTHVDRVRALQKDRYGKLNSMLTPNEIQERSGLTDDARKRLQFSAEKLKLSPRSYIRTIKVARTIADLEVSDTIEEPHILEALQFRPKLDY